MRSRAIQNASGQDENERGGIVPRGLMVAALLLFVSASASAQTITSGEGPQAVARAEAPQVSGPAQTPEVTVLVETPPAEPDGFKVGGFTFKPGGRIKLDIIRDFDAITSEDSFDPRTIPVDGTEGGNSAIHARETRLFLDIRGPIEGKELKMYVETDFYGSGNVLRLRHAYGSWGGLLAGQTWSTFLDDANFPNTIDFEAPMAFPSIRQAQVRWTQKFGANVTWAAAVEDNKSTITPPPGIPGKTEYPMPDLVTHARYAGSHGHVFASVFLGQARFRPTTGDPDSQTLWGGLLSTRIKTFGRDYLYGQFTFGDGVGRYRGALTAIPDASGELQAIELTALMGGYEHFWSERTSSNFVLSRASSPEKDFSPPQANEQLDYAAINFLYWFLPNRAWVGVEYLHGGRVVFSGQDGDADRLQFAVRFNLP